MARLEARRRRVVPAPDQPRPARRRSASSCGRGWRRDRRARRRDAHRRVQPDVLTREEVPAETVENERRVAEATAREEGKPEAALPKIVEGRVNGFFKENVLLEQAFAKDAKKTVGKVLDEAGATATAFARFRVGA